MKSRLHFLARVISSLVLAVSMSAGSAHAEAVLRARLNSDILSTEPGMLRDGNTDQVLLHIAEGLVAYRENGAVGPMLAQSWTLSPDGRTYTFALRHGVYFHNGAPMTAADVVWSLKRYLAKGPLWRCADTIGPKGMTQITDVKARDPYTVDVTLSRPAPLFLATLARMDCGETAILSPASVDAAGKWIAPIGTGPFKFAEWKRNQYIDVVRFDRYSALPGPRDGNTGGKAPLVDRVRFLIVPDSSAATGALLRGNLDVLGEVSYVDYETVRRRTDIVVDVTSMEDINTILLQTKDPLLSDARMRRAIALTVDTAGLARVITHGTALANNSPVPRPSVYFGPVEAKLRGVNLQQAKALAAQAGYRGQVIHLTTNHRYPEDFDAAVLVQAMAHDAGINIDIDSVDWATEVAKYSAGNYQMLAFSFSSRLDPAFNYQLFIGDKTREPKKVWDSARAQALLETLSDASDASARQAAADQLQALFLEDTPAIVTFNSARISAYRRNVVGFRSWLTGFPRYWGVSLAK